MKRRGEKGEAVMAVIMGVMIVGGLILWAATGHFHMMPGHGNRPAESGVSSVPPHGAEAEKDHASSRPGGEGGVEAPRGIGVRPGVDTP
ncbi:MAG: hypothetical protein M1550_06600 [Deltaproteobacteria bacterium]|nr:hypothetical protein [Deltaproteobacteria bacterium]